ncbi:MAG TPA: HyaD/HybD family hydrogenase maturation endopeptidase [Desulfatirhabdiaceae bacterium]|nr:HyaD/HybD family hydrogenase maturation endopeptidase [Desulfatirhabdiaceae bacterium]
MNLPHIMIMGIGCILYRDEGFGVRVLERLMTEYEFPDHVSLVDGGVLGVNLLGVMSQADHLIVIDAIRNKGFPGTPYRLEKQAISDRIRLKNSLHQVDFIEALTLCQALDNVPETVYIGVEPEDIDTLSLELSPPVQNSIETVMNMVLAEMNRLGVTYHKRDVPLPLENRCVHSPQLLDNRETPCA